MNAVKLGAGFYDGNHDNVHNPVDLNSNGKWDPNEDRPDLLGDITAFCVYNDGVPSSQRAYTDVSPQGIEIQQTVFAQKDSAALNNVIFVKYTLINRGTAADVLDSVYFGLYSDADIGYAYDNLVGSDTLLNGLYTYKNGPDKYFGNNPPSLFAQMLQVPAVYIPGLTFNDVNGNGVYDNDIDIPIDSAYNRKGPLLGIQITPGARNLEVSSSINMPKNNWIAGEPYNKEIARNLLKGRTNDGFLVNPCIWPMGQVIGEDCTQMNKLFWYSGNPITQTGWINNDPDEQRQMLNTGPFQLYKNKPVDILEAYMAGRGSDAYNSVSVVKNIAEATRSYYFSNFPNSIISGIIKPANQVSGFQLYQNYPNPFNPSTTIRFDLPNSGRIKLCIYDILGREVAVLINEMRSAGNYSIQFNAGKYRLSSGVYFYRIEAGEFVSVKKFIFIK